MTADAYTGTHAMGDGALAGGVELVVNLAQARSRADGGLPGSVVHAEMFEVDQVYGNGAILAAKAYDIRVISVSHSPLLPAIRRRVHMP